MWILPKINLLLNFKPESKVYKFVLNLPIEITESVWNYLQNIYPENSFEKISPIINTTTNKVEGHTEDNLLFDLLQANDKNEHIDIKKIIEKAIEQKIITKQGPWYQIETETCKGINKVKELLEKDKDLLAKVMSKLL